MGRRTRKRVKMVLPIRLAGSDIHGGPVNLLAYTLDISRSGARVGGVKANFNVGEIVTIHYKTRKSKFCVCWIGESGTPRTEQIGISYLAPEEDLWKLELPEEELDDFQVPLIQRILRRYQQRPDERRKDERFPVVGKVYIGRPQGEGGVLASVVDLSLSGCCIETPHRFIKGSTVKLIMKVMNREIEALGVIRVVEPERGIGVQFLAASNTDTSNLDRVVAQLKTDLGIEPSLADASESLLGIS